jgi:uncharacterized protein YjbI with pentapeptide repeats
LVSANLQNTNFWVANLQDAILEKSNLQGANLLRASLRGADLTGTIFSSRTILPDSDFVNGEYTSYWTFGADMTRYTDSNHPDFWQPEWVTEQAEQGEG